MEKSLDSKKVLYLPTLTPVGWKLWSHAGSHLRANFSRLIEKCELLPSCLTQFPKIMLTQTHVKKPCVKWINDNTFLAISDFVDKRFLNNSTFGRLRTSSDFFGDLRKWSCRLQKSQHSQYKNLMLISQKKLAGIRSWILDPKLNCPNPVFDSYFRTWKKVNYCSQLPIVVLFTFVRFRVQW